MLRPLNYFPSGLTPSDMVCIITKHFVYVSYTLEMKVLSKSSSMCTLNTTLYNCLLLKLAENSSEI